MGGGWLVGRGVSWGPCKGPDRLAGRAGGSVEQGDAQSHPESASWLLTADGKVKSALVVRRARETPGPLPAFLGYQPPSPHGAAGR